MCSIQARYVIGWCVLLGPMELHIAFIVFLALYFPDIQLCAIEIPPILLYARTYCIALNQK